MPYGRPSSAGHGRRTTRYRWAPSFDSASPRRKPRRSASRITRQRRTRPCLPSWNWEDAFATPSDGRGIPNWYFSLVGSLLLLALAIHFPALLVLGIFRWIMDGADNYSSEAEKRILSTMDEMTDALRIRRKTSVDAPPEPEAIRAAWEASRRSLAGKLLAGTLLSNLEPVVDQSYIRNEDGTVIGRRPGIKGWLAANCPDMLPHYKALMSYKALADKLRMALGVEEPDTLFGVLDFEMESQDATDDRPRTVPETSGLAMQETTKTPNHDEAASGKVAKDAPKRVGRRGISPKSLQIKSHIKLLKSNVMNVILRVNDINAAMARAGGGETMKALDAAVRERLNLVWMRRGRRQERAA